MLRGQEVSRMTHNEIKMFLIKRYSLDAATASEQAKLLMEDHHYLRECPKVFTPESLSNYLDRMEELGDSVKY